MGAAFPARVCTTYRILRGGRFAGHGGSGVSEAARPCPTPPRPSYALPCCASTKGRALPLPACSSSCFSSRSRSSNASSHAKLAGRQASGAAAAEPQQQRTASSAPPQTSSSSPAARVSSLSGTADPPPAAPWPHPTRQGPLPRSRCALPLWLPPHRPWAGAQSAGRRWPPAVPAWLRRSPEPRCTARRASAPASALAWPAAGAQRGGEGGHCERGRSGRRRAGPRTSPPPPAQPAGGASPAAGGRACTRRRAGSGHSWAACAAGCGSPPSALPACPGLPGRQPAAASGFPQTESRTCARREGGGRRGGEGTAALGGTWVSTLGADQESHRLLLLPPDRRPPHWVIVSSSHSSSMGDAARASTT